MVATTGPSNLKKRKQREGGNIARTHRSPGTMPIPPPSWHNAVIDIDSSPTDDFNRPIEPQATEGRMGVSMSPLSLLGGDLHLGRRVLIGLSPSKQELISVAAEREIAEGRVATLECQLAKREAEVTRLAQEAQDAKDARVVMQADYSRLEKEKGEVEAGLDRNYAETLELLNQSFAQVVHQAHVC
ncbi:hypothetical protein VNO80_01480 [Phaseolus coccineus]|uniref:Uncharacterized protein n=1 Tax=Phaseolus coccineus TaxID=3886 RepID=A0AAN9WWT1_PHACN